VEIILCSVNARNIHASPALYSIKEYGLAHGAANIGLREYALHTPTQHILAEIYHDRPELLGFSVYIWNAEHIRALVGDIRKLLPNTIIMLGGPEATARPVHYLEYTDADCVCIGEGEESFTAFVKALENMPKGDPLPDVPGIMVKGREAAFVPAPLPDLDKLPFLYDRVSGEHLRKNSKLVYYESSRGCPFSCSFCSSAETVLRTRDLGLVLEELSALADIGGQVKFIDRSFNADKKRAAAITKRILELARPGLSWHFEVYPFALDDELVELWNSAPEGYLHLELGVQTLYPPALSSVGRRDGWDMAQPFVERLIKAQRCHVHLDLIAGLPKDTPKGFSASFHRLHQMNADYLQFGFLKVLPGSVLERQAEELGLVYGSLPPYQILHTPHMSAEYLFELHKAERVFNALYNKTHEYRPLLIAAAEKSGDALSLYLQAAEKAPSGRGMNPGELQALAENIAAGLDAK